MKTIALFKYLLLTAFLIPMFSACVQEDDDKNIVISDSMAVIATTQYGKGSSSAHTVVTVDDDRNASDPLKPSPASDFKIVAYGDYFYRLDLSFDTVQKYSRSSPNKVITEFSVTGDDLKSNSHDLVFSNESKAYLLRYDAKNIWIVNPSATTDSEFKLGEFDFSHHELEDENLRPHSGIIVNDLLYIVFQRFDINWTAKPAIIAVIDTTSNQEIDTDDTVDGIQAISLELSNPDKIIFQSDLNKLLVQASGLIFASEEDRYNSGGITTIDISTYQVEVLIDDTEDTKNIYNMAIVSDEVGYYISYAGWEDNYIFEFNPTTGEVASSSISPFDGKNISDIEVDKDGNLWVASVIDSSIYVLDTTSNELTGKIITTKLPPRDIAFVTLPAESTEE